MARRRVPDSQIREVMQELGRRGGKARRRKLSARRRRQIARRGGKARRRKLSAARRREIARGAAKARWGRRKGAEGQA